MGAVTSGLSNAAGNVLGSAGKAVNIGASPIGGMLGANGGAGGTGFSAPEQAQLQAPVTPGQVQQAQGGVNNSLASQNALLAALQSQNGFGQQNAVAQQQQALQNQLSSANGIGTQNAAISGLENTAGLYSNVANGVGPNPALAALHNATGQNIANQAALMAGQRGAGANVGLLARQAAQQGAATEQQAVGQAAAQQANQQLGALSGLASTQQAVGGLGSAQLSAQQAQQQALANQANIVAGQQIGATQTGLQANLANTQQQQNALGALNNAKVSNQGNVNAGNTQLANTALGGQQKLYGGFLNAAGPAIGSLAKGGEVKKMAEGGVTTPVVTPPVVSAPLVHDGPTSSFGNFLRDWGNGMNPSQSSQNDPNQNYNFGDKNDPLTQGSEKFGNGVISAFTPAAPEGEAMAGGAGVADLAPLAALAAKGGLAKTGGHVKAKKESQKAVKKGDSYDNDKVPAMLSAGEIVLPRSVTQSKDPIKASADFVAKVLAKRKASQ